MAYFNNLAGQVAYFDNLAEVTGLFRQFSVNLTKLRKMWELQLPHSSEEVETFLFRSSTLYPIGH